MKDQKLDQNNESSENFQFLERVKQEDLISAVLFSLCFEKVIQEAEINREGPLYHRKHQFMSFADDVVVLTRGK